MDEEIPLWLDDLFLATVLKGGEEKEPQISVTNFTVNLAVKTGNNYMSHLYRVKIQYKVGKSDEKSISIIVKAPLAKGAVMELIEKNDFFGKEPKIYNELLPVMNEKVNCNFSPKIFYCPVKNGLVLEDMNEEGYTMCDRYKQLDYSHCRCVFMTLAKFHATSIACYHENPDLIEAVSKEQVYIEGGPFEKEFKDMIKRSVKAIGEIVNNMGEHKPSADLLLSKADNIAEPIFKMAKRKMSGFNVLNHGDLWTNNILFKHNSSGEVVDVKLIDFQLTRFTSPVLDLVYFIWTSANEDVRENKLQDLYNVYLETLNNTLEQLGCEERLILEEFQEDLKSSIDWAIATICYVLPVIICETKDVVNLEDIQMEDVESGTSQNRFQNNYNGKHYRKLLPNIMKQIHVWASE